MREMLNPQTAPLARDSQQQRFPTDTQNRALTREPPPNYPGIALSRNRAIARNILAIPVALTFQRPARSTRPSGPARPTSARQGPPARPVHMVLPLLPLLRSVPANISRAPSFSIP
eukprot:9225523-Pyramimonas_sp.AAC.1